MRSGNHGKTYLVLRPSTSGGAHWSATDSRVAGALLRTRVKKQNIKKRSQTALSKRIRSRRTPTRTAFRHPRATHWKRTWTDARAWRTRHGTPGANSHHRAVSYAMPFRYFHWFVTSDIFENRARGTPSDAVPRPTDANNALPDCRTAAGRRVCLSALARSSSSGGVRADGWQRERRCLVS